MIEQQSWVTVIPK